MSLQVKLWGVRGSIACPSANHIVYGGNTSCIQVTANNQHIILDAGTGIRGLGKVLAAEGVQQSTLLLTHTHWDHINGFPFFAPAFMKGHECSVYAGHLDNMSVRDVMAEQMRGPMFPVPLDALQATLRFVDFAVGEVLQIGGIRIRTAPLRHPNGATGYRLEYNDKSVCYVTDTEHVPGKPDRVILNLIDGADLVIYDSTYTDDEFPSRVGWGHSTWQEAVRLARQADVKRVVLFHHDPDHDDTFMAKVEAEAKALWENTIVARDNMVLSVE